MTESAEVWEARANALLGVFKAALAIAEAPFDLMGARGSVYVGRPEYDHLRKEVHRYLMLCQTDEPELVPVVRPQTGRQLDLF